jgi:hypothetical protein
MLTRQVLLLLGVVAVHGSWCALAGQAPTPQKAMAARLAAYADGLKRGDHNVGDSLFTLDAYLINRFGELHGPARLDTALVQLFATTTVTEATLTITAAEVSDTIGTSLGCYTETLSRTGQALEHHAGTFIAVWHRQSNGAWKIWRVISTEAAAC